jgi:4-carboxymuconolactone decarboxylase
MPTDDHESAPWRPSEPRLAPLTTDEQDGIARELLGEAGGAGGGATHIFTTLVRHPGLFRRWLPFGGKLLAGKLPARDRELLILRAGWNNRSAYEWAQHVRIARGAGLTRDEIERVRAPEGADAPGWSAADALLVRAADELHADACLSDDTWAALAARYDEPQLVEVPMVVGHYTMLAFALNSLGVQVEDDVAAANVRAAAGGRA